MRRKIIVFVAIATVAMLTTVFSSTVFQGNSNFNEISAYNTQVQQSASPEMKLNASLHSVSSSFNIINSNPAEKNWLVNAYNYAYEKYGINASSNRLDFLQYQSMIGFFKWYGENFEQLPVEQRNLTKSNLGEVFRTYFETNPGIDKILNEITDIEKANYERGITAEDTNITLDGQGTLVSNVSISYNNSVAYVLTYSYHLNYTTFTYTMMLFDGKKTLLDPTIMENEFQLWDWIIHYGTSYNTNLKFTDQVNAVTYENFVIGQTNSYGVTVAVAIALAFALSLPFLGAAAAAGEIAAWFGTVAGQAIVGVIGVFIAAVVGVITGNTLASNVRTLFDDQWNAHKYFWIVYTVNFYFYVTSSASIWGPVGSGTYQVFSSEVPLPTEFNMDIYIYYWEQFANTYGQSTWVGEPAPSWTDWMEYWP